MTTPMAAPTFKISELINTSWEIIKSQLVLVAALTVVMLMGIAGSSSLSVLGWPVSVLLTTGYTACLLRVREGKKFDFEDFLWGIRSMTRLLNVLLVQVLVWLMIMVGLILLLVPGIYVSVPLTLASTVLVRSDVDAVTAIKRSFEMSKGYWWDLAGLGLVIFLLNIVGALCFLVGVLITIPMSVIILFLAIEALEKQHCKESGQGFVNQDLPPSSTSSSIQVNPHS